MVVDCVVQEGVAAGRGCSVPGSTIAGGADLLILRRASPAGAPSATIGDAALFLMSTCTSSPGTAFS